MSTGFLSRMLSGCQHQFAWPRRDENGGYYQLCVNCGTKYGYDWNRMCRTAQVSNDPIGDVGIEANRAERKSTWKPRERRLRYRVSLQVRVCGSEEWQEATSDNISRSGLLFHCAMAIHEGESLELKLEMPKELTGESPAPVLCRGEVARVTEGPGRKEGQSYLVACSIKQYEFASKSPGRAIVETIRLVAGKKRQGYG